MNQHIRLKLFYLKKKNIIKKELKFLPNGKTFKIDLSKCGSESQASALISIVLHNDDLAIDEAGKCASAKTISSPCPIDDNAWSTSGVNIFGIPFKDNLDAKA